MGRLSRGTSMILEGALAKMAHPKTVCLIVARPIDVALLPEAARERIEKGSLVIRVAGVTVESTKGTPPPLMVYDEATELDDEMIEVLGGMKDL